MERISFFFRIYLLVLPLATLAAVDAEPLSTADLHARYQHLIAELRCPKCQNQNLADSDSPISADLRRQIRQMLEAGRSDVEIEDYLVARYGDYILYRPRLQDSTYLLWLAPGVLLVTGALLFFLVVRRQRQSVRVQEAALDAQDKAQLDLLLASSQTQSPAVEERNAPADGET